MKRMMATAMVVAVFGALGAGSGNSNNKKETGELKNASPDSGLNRAELQALFELGSKNTDLQREEKEKEIKGKVIDWDGVKVYEVSKSGECFRIQTSSSEGNTPGMLVRACPPEGGEASLFPKLTEGDVIRVKGKISGVTMRSLDIDPAIVTTTGR